MLNLIWFIFSFIDSYRNVYLGSKLAANIQTNSHIEAAFEAFKWIFIIISVFVNWEFVAEVLIELADVNFCLIFLVFYPLAGLGAIGVWLFPFVENSWQENVWLNACKNWDINAVVQGESFDCWPNCNASSIIVGVAIVLLAHGNYTMQLQYTRESENFYDFAVNQTYNFTPLLSNIAYNFANATYSISDIITSYVESPNLAFPALNLELRDPSIPFFHLCYPPSANLIRCNRSVESNVLMTVTLNADDTTELRVYGMQDGSEDFQIALGIVTIAQFKYSVCSNQ